MKKGFSINGKGRKWYFFAYTLCFAVMAAAIFSVFLLYKKSFVWVPDGLQQHFNALLYYRRWLLDIIHTLTAEHRLEIPLWDLSIGMGSDILTTLHYYVIGDPLNLLSVFVPGEQYMEGFYCGLVLFRLYLAGLSFSAYCRYHGQEPYCMLLGTLVYTFCSWSIVAMRHPYFLNPMIYLPLILIGVDKIYKKEKPWLYVGMLAVSTVSSFYFAYMICIFVVGYALLRYLMIFRKIELKNVLKWVGKFVGYSLAALASVSVILLPVVMMTLSTGRAGAEHDFSILYPFSYYRKFLSGFLIGGAGYWSELGYTGLILVAAIFLLSNRRKYTGLRIAFVFMTLLLLLPYGGLMLNGGGYVINRFVWAYSMLVSFIAVKMYPQIMEMQKKKRVELLVAGGLYMLLCLVICTKSQKRYLVAALVMFAVLLGLIIGTRKKTKEKALYKGVLLAVVMVELVYQGWVKYAPWAEGYVEEFADRGEAYHMLTDDAAGSLVKNAAKDGSDTVWRYESLQAEEWKNTAMQLGLYGVSYYFSLANPYINEFQREMYLNQTRDFCYSGLDGRTLLDRLAGVKYFVVPEQNRGLLPYGYDTLINRGTLGKGSRYEVAAAAYESDDVLPLGFASDTYISREQYGKMTVTEKQQALLQGIVVEDGGLPESLTLADPVFTDENLPCEVTEIKGARWVEGGIAVEEENARVTMKFHGLPESETYFIFEGLDYKGNEGLKKKPQSRLHIQVTCGAVSKKITFLTDENNFYSGVTDFLINTGYREEAPEEITVEFQETGTYYFEEMRVAAQPMEAGQAGAFVQETLEAVSIGTNEVTGEISVDKEKLLCLTLPYSTGWDAYVDGEETEILQADTMFMAILVPEGSHEIRLTYGTPYLKAGGALSLIGLGSIGCMAAVPVLCKKVRKKKPVYLSGKKEYRAIDFAKFIAAFLVAAIHIPPLEDCSPWLSHEVQQVICRMAVPFFFLCTGFFLGGKLCDRERTKRYLFHILKMYLFWTLCYCLPMIERFWKGDRTFTENAGEMLRRFFLIGSYIQLWYLLATAVAAVLLYVCVSVLKWRDRTLIAAVVFLYVIGVLGNSYRHAFDGVPAVAAGIKFYQAGVLTTRNGIFFGFPFVAAGYLLWKYRGKIRQHSYGVWTTVCLAAMFGEEYLVRKAWGEGSHDMYLLTPAAAVCLFLALAWISLPERTDSAAKLLRRLSTYLFLLHMLVNFWLKKTPLWQQAWVKYSPVHYGIVTGVSILLGLVFCLVQDRWKRLNRVK